MLSSLLLSLPSLWVRNLFITYIDIQNELLTRFCVASVRKSYYLLDIYLLKSSSTFELVLNNLPWRRGRSFCSATFHDFLQVFKFSLPLSPPVGGVMKVFVTYLSLILIYKINYVLDFMRRV